MRASGALRKKWGQGLRAILGLCAWLTAGAAEWPQQTAGGFAVPQPGAVFRFPADHGSHPAFALEWWYVTGHLFETNGLRHGFQATFFRRAGPRVPAGAEGGFSLFGQGQVFLAHMALLDGATGRFLHQERLNRDGWDAVAEVGRLAVTNGNWSLRQTEGTDAMELSGSVRAEAGFELTLVPRKPLVVFGTNGVSRKAADPAASSHYLTFPRLAAEGKLRLPGREAAVTGEAWMDHEYSSSQLGADQVGWDWAGIQLHDGRELMAYRLRQADGSTDASSTLAWVDRSGRVTHLGPSEFGWEAQSTWQSPRTGATYPARTVLSVRDPATGGRRTFTLVPLAADQELDGSLGGIPYWEGACRVLDGEGLEIGRAFMELTGYAGTLRGRL